MRNPIRKKVLTIILLFMVVFSSPATMAASSVRGNLFIEMMLAMMDFMGLIDRNRDYYSQPYPNFNPYLNMSPYGTSFPGGGYPGLSGFGNWNNIRGVPGLGGTSATIPYLPEYFNQNQTPYRKHWIEGRWIANDNMIMEVRDGEFVMYYRDNPRQVRKGLIRLKDRWLAIAEQTRKITRQYEYAYKKDVLVLRDIDGNLMLFRRMTDWPIPLQ